jgi:DNA mismatch endonuclease (patch repair protein)
MPLETDANASMRMSRVRQHSTAPELLVRHACRALGLRYRKNNRDLPGSPDLANRSRRWAIFVHGCYWHRHAGCMKASTPKTNLEFWGAKFRYNVARDRRARRALDRRRYHVLTIWECEAESQEKLKRRMSSFVRSLRISQEAQR